MAGNSNHYCSSCHRLNCSLFAVLACENNYIFPIFTVRGMPFSRGRYTPGGGAPAPQLQMPSGSTVSAPGGHSRGNSTVSSLLGHAGQVLGAIAVPSPTSSGPASPASHPLPPSFGHPQQHHQLPHSASSPATSTIDTFLRLPPVSATGTGTGIPGTGYNNNRNQPTALTASLSAANTLPYLPHSYPNSHYHDQAPSSTSPTNLLHTSPSAAHRSGSYATSRQQHPTGACHTQHLLASGPTDALVPGLKPSIGSDSVTDTGSASASTSDSRPMFNLPSIPTSSDDFASIPHLHSSTTTPSAPTPKDTMSQQQQPQQFSGAPRRGTGYGEEQQHHLQGSSQYQQHGQMSPRDYSSSSAGPHIKLDQAPSPSYQSTSTVPSVLQPGGPLSRPPAAGANTAPSLPTMQGSIPQQQDYQTSAKPSLNLSHSYSRSSPAAGYDGSNPAFSPYSPTTPSGAGPSSAQFMSPADRSYNAPGSQRNISHTPLGLADIRPRADSSLSDGMPSGLDFAMQNTPPGTSNYMAPWATYAFDWCKWAPQGNGAGKVAIGSYLEDGHNFVSPSSCREAGRCADFDF